MKDGSYSSRAPNVADGTALSLAIDEFGRRLRKGNDVTLVNNSGKCSRCRQQLVVAWIT